MIIEAHLEKNLATIDMAKKRIYLRFTGFLSVKQAEELKEAYRAAIAKVGRGYTVLTVFDNFKPGKPEVQDIIASMIQMASRNGCRKAARYSKSSVLGQMQLGRLSRNVEATYPTLDCASFAEAEAFLDEA